MNIEHAQQSAGSGPTCFTAGVSQTPIRGFGVAESGTFSGGTSCHLPSTCKTKIDFLNQRAGLLYDVSFLLFENGPGEDLLPDIFPLSRDDLTTYGTSAGEDRVLDDRIAASTAASPPHNESDHTAAESGAQTEPSLTSTMEIPASQGSSSVSDNGNDVPKWLSPLHMASSKGQTRITRILLEHNVDCDEKDSDGQTPLMHAIMSGSEEMVRLLLVHGASIGIKDRRHRSAFHHAVLHRRQALLRMLLDHCPYGDARTRLLESYDDSGRTQLHVAVDEEFEEGVFLLLQFGANPCSRMWGQEIDNDMSKD